ncbi:MAG: aspartate aminotransferase family protein [Thermoprotei archaeon]
MDPVTADEKFGSPSYQKLPLVVERGSGAKVWDNAGREYIDYLASYGVAFLGHSNPSIVEAVSEQAQKLMSCHGSFYNQARSDLLERLVEITPRGLTRVYLSNSGAEAVEVAIKLARRYTRRKKIVSMKGGYHGKTYGALSATWNPKYREPFEPLVPGFVFAEYGDADSLKSCVDSDTACVIVEPIQGESGVIVPPKDYLSQVREVCDAVGALMVADEIQTGLGRTGRMWACEHSGVTPDILLVGKVLGGGLPLSATVTREDVGSSLGKGEHTSTYAGNPLVCAAGVAAIRYITSNDVCAQAARKGGWLLSELSKIVQTKRSVRSVRGLGLMIGVELKVDVRTPLLAALTKGLIVGYSGRTVLRLLPPVVTDEKEMSKAVEVLDLVLQ